MKRGKNQNRKINGNQINFKYDLFKFFYKIQIVLQFNPVFILICILE